MKNLLDEAIAKIADLKDEKPHKVSIKGKWYTTVATRVAIFREIFGTNVSIKTEIVSADLERVCVKSVIQVYQNGSWDPIATGYAEEFRGDGMVNKTSALENCETSAIGRALANLGIHGGEYASSFEVDNAVNNKAEAPELEKYTLIDVTGEDLGIYMGEDALVKELRKQIGVKDPEQFHKDFFSTNFDTILLASKNAKGKSHTALAKILALYWNNKDDKKEKETQS